jgi:hypothetical protein
VSQKQRFWVPLSQSRRNLARNLADNLARNLAAKEPTFGVGTVDA